MLAAASSAGLVRSLEQIVGKRHVLTSEPETRKFATGYRFGAGPVLAVVRPASPREQFEAFVACVEADVIVIVQAANTGLTGGSTPCGEYDRRVVIINTLRIRDIHLIDDGKQVVCLAGATLFDLERKLAPLGREPHSVIGSSCIGASVVGGICNNSGGALIRRGPAYTELSIHAKVTEEGRVALVNHLGIELGDDPASVLEQLRQGKFPEQMVSEQAGAASTSDYSERVRDVEADTPARFNADPVRLFEASGSAGKVMVLAVRLDTFPKDETTATFYIGSNDTAELEILRRKILSDCDHLPVSGEYIHRGAFDVAARYGKDVFLAIELFGTDRLPLFFSMKSRIDRLARRLPFLPELLSDKLLQALSTILPQHLPKRMRSWRDQFEHHLILKCADDGIEEARKILEEVLPSASGNYFECTPREATKAFLQRFAVAGAAVRYKAIHTPRVGDIIALDIALRRNEEDWLERLPEDIAGSIDKAIYYGHFFCHVMHQDYVLKPGIDAIELEHRMWELLDARGAEYPAEHNVGHLYPANLHLEEHYRRLDPGNHLNPGIGKTSRMRNWG